ncbi:MAG: pyruvate kinase alpha/beta domain-containing protein [Candidatus Bathyarchaeia archaeon]
MSNIEWPTVYFERPGRENTDETLRLAKARADSLGVKSIVVASSTGWTASKAADVFRGYNFIVVTHVVGFREPNERHFSDESREKVLLNGGRLVTAAHAFGGIGRAINRKFGAIQIDEIIANVLRRFGEGTKVACEVTCMAADAGYVRTDEDVIGIGGTGGGADTALLIKPSNTHTFFDMRIREVICKPRL